MIGFARTLSGRLARQPFTPVLVQVEEMEERPGDLELGKATRRTRMFLSRRSCALIACDGWQNYTNFHLHRILRYFKITISQLHYRKYGFPSIFRRIFFANFLLRKFSNGSLNQSIEMEENWFVLIDMNCCDCLDRKIHFKASFELLLNYYYIVLVNAMFVLNVTEFCNRYYYC